MQFPKKKKQASNFILDISKSPLDEREIVRQIEDIYWSRHTMFVQKIIVIKDEKIRKIYKRNREKIMAQPKTWVSGIIPPC